MGDSQMEARGPDGLLDGKSTGQPSKLNDTQRLNCSSHRFPNNRDSSYP